jgi:hypothetical protein
METESCSHVDCTYIVLYIVFSTDFRPSQWLIIGVNSIRRSSRCVDVGDVAEISEVYAAPIFRIEMYKVGGFLDIYIYKILFCERGEWTYTYIHVFVRCKNISTCISRSLYK